jgi:protein associated with RNAse G/E
MTETRGELISVHSRKYDGSIHRRWRARVRRVCDSLIVLDAVFAEEINHPLLGRIVPGTLSTEYFWTDRWYNVFRFREPSGTLRNYYCNVNAPATLEGGVLTFLDLDIDVLVAPDFSYSILDEDEFEQNAARYKYPPDILRRSHQALDELLSLIEGRQFPFDEDEDEQSPRIVRGEKD